MYLVESLVIDASAGNSMTYTHTQLLNVADSGLYWCVEVSSQLHK